MKKFAFLSTVASVALLAGAALADHHETWPNKGDVPAVDASILDQAEGSVEAELVKFYKVQNASGGTISPDGKTIAYRTLADGLPQLWSVPVQGGKPKQITSGGAVRNFYWTPDSKGLVYFADTDGDELTGFTYITADGSKQRVLKGAGDAFTSFGGFSSDSQKMIFSTTQRNGDDYDLYIQDMDGGKAVEAYQGRFGWFAEAWQPGGDYIIVTETRGEDAVDLYFYNVKTEKMITIYSPKVAANFTQFEWRSDGSGFYMATNLGTEYQGLAYYDIASGELSRLETPDADIDAVSLGGNDRYLAWVINNGGYSTLKVRDLATNALVDMPDLPKGVYSMEVASDAPVLKLGISSPQIPGDIWSYDFESKELVRATNSSTAGLDLSQMVLPEAVTFKAQDGVDLYGLFYPPRDAAAPKSGKPPVVVKVHGGPTGQAKPDFTETIQYLAARGYAVLDLNFRGSTGFGKTFARLDDKRNRTNSVRDVKDAMTWLEKSGRVDTSRAAVTGRSYGGYLVNAVVGDYPDLFSAAVSYVGVSDWVRALEDASPALKASDRLEYGDITDKKDRAFFASISPINKADKIKTPILVQHGANDPRDPVAESDTFVKKIRDAGGKAEYIRLKDEGHIIQKLNNIVYTSIRVGAFLDTHLMGGEPAAPATQAAAQNKVTAIAKPEKSGKPADTQAEVSQSNSPNSSKAAEAAEAAAGVAAGTSGAIAALAESENEPMARQLADVQAQAKANQKAIEAKEKAAEAKKMLEAAEAKAAAAQAAADKAAAALEMQKAAAERAEEKADAADKKLNQADVAIAKAQAEAVEAKARKAKAEAMLEEADAKISANTDALKAAQAEKLEAEKIVEEANKVRKEQQDKVSRLKASAEKAQASMQAAQAELDGTNGIETADKGLLEKASDIVKSVVDKVTGDSAEK